jgi:hypothetical protein
LEIAARKLEDGLKKFERRRVSDANKVCKLAS